MRFLSEGRWFLAEALEREKPARSTPERARASNRAGMLAYRQGDDADGHSRSEEGQATWRALGNQPGMAETLNVLGSIAWGQGDCRAARSLYEERLAIRREPGNRWGTANSLP